jgi:trehalose 6-phosphate synthase
MALLATGLTLVTFVITWKEVRTQQLVQQIGLQERAERLAERLQELVEPALRYGSVDKIGDLTEGLATNEHIFGVAIYDIDGRPLAISSSFAKALEGRPSRARCGSPDLACGAFITMGGVPTYVSTTPLHRDHTTAAVLTTFHDASGLSMRSVWLWWDALWHVTPPMLLIVLATIGAVQLTVLRPIARTARWMRDLRVGRSSPTPHPGDDGLLGPISVEAASMAQSLASARAAAEEEAQLRAAGDSRWTAERLRVGMRATLQGTRLFVVSNREPHEHVHRGKTIAALVPASGLVTALEPVLCACDGTWIAHGSGSADREVVDARNRVRVPPDNPRYTLRRVWLTHEEQQGYYFGFANEGLWPLCHIAHTRPTFRVSDWEQYQSVNRKFAETVLEELEGTERPFLLVQDYHFALLPALVKAARPDARIAVFWHIPWPNPEAFGICPWQRELLDGLLGADIVSFHIQAHCTNFLQTIDRFLECRIEWERSTINRRNHSTIVRPHPISVAPPKAPESLNPAAASDQDSVVVRQALGVTGLFLGIGVDRVDYTKGIIERFRAIECLLEKYPAYREGFTLAQIGAPSRTQIKRYQDLLAEVETEAQRINKRFQTGNWKPILLFSKHHDHVDIRKLYQAADMCMVTSLHDGMNLVAKEFVAARDDEDGVLILSQFAGAACELRDALVVNPYDIEQIAESIRVAIEMPPDERRSRMRHMRRVIREHNVYRWASELIGDLSEV